jgi:hypothetical protein
MNPIMKQLPYDGNNNPCTGKWNLCESPIDYLHSSAKYYAVDWVIMKLI